MATVLITGGAGFIGSHVVAALQARGERAIILDDLSTGLRANVPPGVEVLIADIADHAALGAATAGLPPLDAIVHCAAQASVTTSIADPARDHAVNAIGTEHVLALCDRWQCPLVFTSTAGIYGPNAPRPTAETAAVEPMSPYAASKAAAERSIRAHAERSGLPHAICRLANVYGPRQRGDGEAGVVAVFAHRLRAGEPVTLYGFGTPTRDFVHVTDVAAALLTAHGTLGTFNVATETETSVRTVYDLACAALGLDAEPLLADLRPGEILHSSLSTAHTLNALGWQARIAVADGLPQTIRALGA